MLASPPSGCSARRFPPGARLESRVGTSRLPRSYRETPRLSRRGPGAFGGVFGREPLVVRAGGTLPVLAALARREIPTVMAGLALPDSHTHSPNERMLVETFPLGVAAARETYRALGAL